MLSGRSTVVVARWYDKFREILAKCRSRLGLADDYMELWHANGDGPGTEEFVRDWPGIKRRRVRGEIVDYQLVAR
eukprot:4053386-Amphidinium_carterae.1